MKKFILPMAVFAFTLSGVANHGAPEAYFYKQEFDKLVMDFTIPSGRAGESDTLEAITLKNEGTVKRNEDFTKLILWKDAGEQGFQGMGIDEKLGEFTFWYENYYWYLSDLNTPIPSDGARMFVSTEIKKDMTYGRFFKMQIPVLLDYNEDGVFDKGDFGIYLGSKNNGPTDGSIINPKAQTLRSFVAGLEILSPKSVITNLESGSSLTTTTLEIKGRVRDQGGSSIQWVKVGITPLGGSATWYQADSGAWDGDEQNWEYELQNITAGDYTIRSKSIDWNDNKGISDQEIQLTIIAEAEESEESVIPSDSEESQLPKIEESSIIINTLKAQIRAIQQQIIQVLQQLIELLKNQLGFIIELFRN